MLDLRPTRGLRIRRVSGPSQSAMHGWIKGRNLTLTLSNTILQFKICWTSHSSINRMIHGPRLVVGVSLSRKHKNLGTTSHNSMIGNSLNRKRRSHGTSHKKVVGSSLSLGKAHGTSHRKAHGTSHKAVVGSSLSQNRKIHGTSINPTLGLNQSS